MAKRFPSDENDAAQMSATGQAFLTVPDMNKHGARSVCFDVFANHGIALFTHGLRRNCLAGSRKSSSNGAGRLDVKMCHNFQRALVSGYCSGYWLTPHQHFWQ